MAVKIRKTKLAIPIGLAVIGLVAITFSTILLFKRADEDDAEEDQDVENYDVKNVPLL
jgi:hypothetical protein